MNWFTGTVVFVITWWVVLFAVLPWGVQPETDPDREKGHMAGAPKKPMLVKKAIVTTLVTAVIWAIVYGVIEAELITFRNPPS